MTDIVERLRAMPAPLVAHNIGENYPLAMELCREAADEIQRLREALRRLAALDEFVGGKPQTIEEVMNYTQFVARAALGEEK